MLAAATATAAAAAVGAETVFDSLKWLLLGKAGPAILACHSGLPVRPAPATAVSIPSHGRIWALGKLPKRPSRPKRPAVSSLISRFSFFFFDSSRSV